MLIQIRARLRASKALQKQISSLVPGVTGRSRLVNGRISNLRDLVDSESVRYFEGDSDLTWDLTNLLTNPNIFFH
jgi:hypothetical protein